MIPDQQNFAVSFNFVGVDLSSNTSVGSITGVLLDETKVKSILSKKYKKYKILSSEEFSSLDQEFLNAYDINKSTLKINLDKAKEIKKEQLRNSRVEKFKDLDVQFMFSIETGDEELKNKIVQEKLRLRNITSDVDLCQTLDEIKSVKI
jgi:hypothetical protein